MTNVVTVAFHGDTLFAVEDANVVGVAIKPICSDLGVAWNKQLQRIKRDPILSKGMTITVTPSPGGPQEMVCLDLHLVAGWLFGIDENRCNEKSRPKVRAYREQCFHVLHDHFFARKGTDISDTLSPPQSMPDQKALSWTEKRLIVGMYQNMAGARAAVEKALELGFGSVPAIDAMMKQGEFRLVFDLDTRGPVAADGVH